MNACVVSWCYKRADPVNLFVSPVGTGTGRRTLRKSSGFPAAKTTLPSSSMIARPISAHTTFAIISNPPPSPSPLSPPSTCPTPAPARARAPDLTHTRSAISINLRRSRSTKRSTVLYRPARGSSRASSAGAGAPDANGFCFDANAVYGVYGVRGGAALDVRGAAGGRGVCGRMGECGEASAPGWIVCR